jgi:hypothetical protein
MRLLAVILVASTFGGCAGTWLSPGPGANGQGERVTAAGPQPTPATLVSGVVTAELVREGKPMLFARASSGVQWAADPKMVHPADTSMDKASVREPPAKPDWKMVINPGASETAQGGDSRITRR